MRSDARYLAAIQHLRFDFATPHLDQAGLIPESQCGFKKDRGTIDMIFTARQLQEKCQEKM